MGERVKVGRRDNKTGLRSAMFRSRARVEFTPLSKRKTDDVLFLPSMISLQPGPMFVHPRKMCTRARTLGTRSKILYGPRCRGCIAGFRKFSSSMQKPSVEMNSGQDASSPISPRIVYEGPLARTFRSLKIFSLSSLGLATAVTPFMFIMDSSLPFVARVVLASTALGTSAVSTALVSWCGHPYVSKIRTLSGENESKSSPAELGVDGIQFETLTLTLRPRFTNVYDTAFLTETRRPFAKWELAEGVSLQESNVAGPDTPAEETVAETMDAEGKVLGRWIVSWSEDRTRGTCRGEGKVQRFFNVHEEILPSLIK